MIRISSIILLVGVLLVGAVEVPYAVLPVGESVSYSLNAGEENLGAASLGWTKDMLVIDVQVNDATPVSLSDAGVALADAYLVDSVEFWVGKRQFVAAGTKDGGRLWDYVFQQPVEKSNVDYEITDKGYHLRIEMPWADLELTAKAGLNLSFLLQINDRQRVKDGEAWKSSGRQLMFPATAVWDRVSTYATVFLADKAVQGSASEPLPLATLDIRNFAYAKKVDATIRPLAPFEKCEFILVCRNPDGKFIAEISIPRLLSSANSTDKASLLLPIPWDDSLAGIFSAEVYLVNDGKLYGPVGEPYFNAGPTPIAEYNSDRKAPADLGKFWDKKIKQMRALPMNAKVTEVKSDQPGVIVEKVLLENHRGAPMVVWLSRKEADKGPLCAYLNVYPPMRADGPVKPLSGTLGLTFCGSRQGECRMPEQTGNEGLWARAENLDESYWLDVVLDGVRAMDYVATRSDSNGKTIVTGGSRGGWYSLVLSAVAPDRVALGRFTSPCYSDVTMNQKFGYNSAATEIRIAFQRDAVQTEGKIFENFQYFDPLFLAELIRTPVVFSAGLTDDICSAIGMTAAANRIPKEFCTFILDPEGHHGGSPWMNPINQAYEKQAMLAEPAD